MADTVTIRVVLLAEAAKDGLRRLQNEVDDLGGKTKMSAKDQKRLGEELDTTGNKADRLTKFFQKLNTNVQSFSTLLKAAKIPVLLGAFKVAVPLVSALSAGIVALTGSLGPLVGMLAAVPGGLLAVVSMVGVVKLATGGISDAVKVIGDPTSTAEELAAALGALSPPAQAYARQLAALRPEVEKFKRAAAEEMLPALGRGLQRVSTLFPTFRQGIRDVAYEMGQMIDQGSAMVSSGPFRADIAGILETNRYAVRGIGKALLSMVSALRHLMVGSRDFVRTMVDWTAAAGRWLDRSARVNRANGDMAAFLERTTDAMRTWGHIIRDFGMALINIFSVGRGLTDDFNGSMAEGSARFREWTESTKGRNSIAKWFADAKPILTATWDLIKYIGGALRDVSKDGRSSVVPTLQAMYPLVDSLVALLGAIDTETLMPAIASLISAVARLLNVASFQPLVDGLSITATVLNGLLDLFDTPVVGEFANALVAVGLAMKTFKVVSKLSGIDKLIGTLNPNKAGGISGFARGLRGKGDTEKNLVNTLGQKLAKAYGAVTGAAGRAATATKRFGIATFQAGKKALVATGRWVAAKAVLIAKAVASGIASAAMWLFNAALSANPIVLIVLALVALAAGLYLAYKKVDWFRAAVDKMWQMIQKGYRWVKENWPLLLAILTGPFGLAVLAIVRNWDSIKDGATAVKDWIVDAWNTVIEFIKGIPARITEALRDMWGGMPAPPVSDLPGTKTPAVTATLPGGGRKGGSGNPLVDWLARNIAGDTARPRAAGGNLARTMAMHNQLAGGNGKQRVTNALYGAYAGSDHRAGRALDLVGSGLQGYAKDLRDAGGYAAFHGSGGDRHLHAVYGDTASPRGGGGTMTAAPGGDSFIVQGPLIGQVIANDDIDVKQAVKRGINEFIRERDERR